MTKLFSMKSLAFAGAAAFAVALAAAPQADAAVIGFEQYTSKDGSIKENVSASSATVLVSKSAVTCLDGELEYYYSSIKSGNDPKKWTAASTTEYSEDDLGNYSITVPVKEISKGKAIDVYIAADAEGANKTTAIECKAAPKIKAALNILESTGPSIKLTSGNDELETGIINFESQYGGFFYNGDVADLKDGTEALASKLKNIADFGGATLTVTYYSDDNMTPSATAKLKVAATPKAPKESLKIAKAFTFKPKKDTMKYRAFAKDTKEELPAWSTGEGTAIAMNTLFGDNTSATNADDEYVLNNTMSLQSKTVDKNGKKSDSRITTTTVYASAATPQAVNAVITNDVKTGRTTTTGASITFATTGLELTQSKSVSSGAVVTLQYKTNATNSKWTDAKANAVKFASGKVPTEIYVRVKGVDYAAAKGSTNACYYEAPGHIMTIKLDVNDPASATYSTTNSSIYVPAADAKY